MEVNYTPEQLRKALHMADDARSVMLIWHEADKGVSAHYAALIRARVEWRGQATIDRHKTTMENYQKVKDLADKKLKAL